MGWLFIREALINDCFVIPSEVEESFATVLSTSDGVINKQVIL